MIITINCDVSGAHYRGLRRLTPRFLQQSYTPSLQMLTIRRFISQLLPQLLVFLLNHLRSFFLLVFPLTLYLIQPTTHALHRTSHSLFLHADLLIITSFILHLCLSVYFKTECYDSLALVESCDVTNSRTL